MKNDRLLISFQILGKCAPVSATVQNRTLSVQNEKCRLHFLIIYFNACLLWCLNEINKVTKDNQTHVFNYLIYEEASVNYASEILLFICVTFYRAGI